MGLFRDVQEMVAATTRCVQPSPWTDGEAPGLSHDQMPVTDGPINVKAIMMYWGCSVQFPSFF